MTRLDLDELEAFYSSIDFDRSPQVVAVIAELRAAREVIEAANDLPRTINTNTATLTALGWQKLDRALVAYDQLSAMDTSEGRDE